MSKYQAFARESFTFYRSFEAAICRLTDGDQLLVYRAISRYSLFGEEPNVDGLAAMCWELIRPTLQKSRCKAFSAQQPRQKNIGNQYAAKNKTNEKPTKNEADTDTDTDTDV